MPIPYAQHKAYILARIEQSSVGQQPFFHSFIENIFPDDLYDRIRLHMLRLKFGGNVHDRHQDNPAFMNRRYNLFDCNDEIVQCIRTIFADPEVMQAILGKFYWIPSRKLVDALGIHEEFEYVYTKGGRHQNIHIDIPPKCVSFVFYIPEQPLLAEDETLNATILYDKSLKPHYKARFKANSVCIFVPHYYSYHGFSSTVDRDALVMFYVHKEELKKWRDIRQEQKDEPPFTILLDAIERKLRQHPLIEFGIGEERLAKERAGCRVNAPQGRVLVQNSEVA